MSNLAKVAWSMAGAGLVAASPFLAESDASKPLFELAPGERYFRSNGRAIFVFGRNPAGKTPAEYDQHFQQAAAAGEGFVRLHLTHFPPHEPPGEILPDMQHTWDAILDAAERHGLAVLPVLDVWSNWNDGSHGENWHVWDKNPFNAARGGPATSPSELLEDTPCRRLWLKRLDTLVRHWSQRRAVVAWEVFSELDLVTGATEAKAVDFAALAARQVRQADPWKRPVTASQAGVLEWPALLRSSALDFLEIHPYSDGAMGGRLDDLLLQTVRQRLLAYGKPVLIGESGLNSGPPRGTLDAAPQAQTGIRHAIWAAIVSGAMNGRALWWQDGYDQFENAGFCRSYDTAATTAAAFVRNVDFTGFTPVACRLSDEVTGAAIGNATTLLAWFRDHRCLPPDWPERPVRGQSVVLGVSAKEWTAEFIDPRSGGSLGKDLYSSANGGLPLPLPEFQGSIAVRLRPRAP